MTILKVLFDLWVVLGCIIGIIHFGHFNRVLRLGSWFKRIWVTFLLGPFWWIMMPLVYFTAWVTK